MTDTTSGKRRPTAGARDNHHNAHRTGGVLEVVLKSGGVYCFVMKTPECAEIPAPVVEIGEVRGLEPKDS